MIKQDDGTFSGLAARDLDERSFGSLAVFDGASSGMLGDDDVAVVADGMEPGEAAAVIVYEDAWAAPFVAAVRRNGGRLIDNQRIPSGDLLDALERVEAT